MRALPLALVVAALAFGPVARADDVHGSVALLGGVFHRALGDASEPGGAVVFSRSLATGEPNDLFQLRSDTHLLAGYTNARTFHGLVALTLGVDLYPVPWFSFDLRAGVAGGLQVNGSAYQPTWGLWGTGAIAVHPWIERGRRIFLVTNATTMVTTGLDSGLGCLFCAGLQSLGVGYETTF